MRFGKSQANNLPNRSTIRQQIEKLGLNLSGVPIIEPATSPQIEAYTQELFKLRQRKGMTFTQAQERVFDRHTFSLLMVHLGEADGLVAGVSQAYPETIRPALQIIGIRPDVRKVAGLYIMLLKDKVFFC